MPKSTPSCWTVNYLEHTDDGEINVSLCHCIVRDLASLEVRIIALTAEGKQFSVNEGEPVVITVDTSPRVTIGGKERVLPTEAKKPRAKRRTREQIEADALAAAAKKAGGKVMVAI